MGCLWGIVQVESSSVRWFVYNGQGSYKNTWVHNENYSFAWPGVILVIVVVALDYRNCSSNG